MAIKKQSKNNIVNRGKSSKLKKMNGQAVSPIMFIGSRLGYGKYIAAKFEDGKLVKDSAGKPIPYSLL